MKRVLAIITAVSLMVVASVAGTHAQSISTASGHYAGDGKTILFSHVVAVGLDNAEGLLEPNVRMRLVISDRNVPPEALFGIAFPPVRDMSKRGELRGVMIELDPHDKTTMTVTVLDQPADPAQFLPTITLSDSNGIWQNLTNDPKQISGRYVSRSDPDLELTFSTPVIYDPVVSDLTGDAAQHSVFMKLLQMRVLALSKGDMTTLAHMSSRNAAAQYANAPSPNSTEFKAYLASYARSLDHVSRIVVRGKTATVLLPDKSWVGFVKEDGEWKLGD